MIPSKLKSLPVTQLMTPAESLSATDSISKLIGYLRNSKLHEAFITEEDRTAIITVRDLLKVRDPATAKLPMLMYYIPRLNPNNTVGDAATLMFEHRIRSLPIYEGKKLKGQITSPSIVKSLLETEIGETAHDVMTPNPICVDASDTVSKARQLMIRRKIDQLPVLEEGKIKAVVTSDAIVFNLMPPTDRNIKGDWLTGRYSAPAGVFGIKDVATNEVKDPLQDVFKNMSAREANYSVITNMGEVQGIVTYRDFMKLLARIKEPDEIPMYIIGLPEDPFEAEAARQKFVSVMQLLKRGFPEITEARVTIKAGETKAPRKKYQVQVFIMSPYRRYSFQVFSYELPDAFDYVSNWVKKLISRYQASRRRSRVDSGVVA